MLRLSDITLPPPAQGHDSLVVALQAVVGWYGKDAPYHEWAGATGIAAMATYTDREACPGRWGDYGRDAFLIDAAGQFGLDLRELHPPEAAPLPLSPPEFEGHFQDSYLPLIETALRHAQPVLAWMGWPGDQRTSWGVITDVDPLRQRCLGRVAGIPGAVALERAAAQVYVVQGHQAIGVRPVELLAAARQRMACILRNRLPDQFGVVTGEAALLRWRARLGAEQFCPVCRADGWRCGVALANGLCVNRLAAARFFGPAGESSLAEAFEATARAAAPLADAPRVRQWICTPTGREELAADVSRVIDHERRTLDLLSEPRP